MFEVMVKAEFSSAHRLRGYEGKCENLHGHNWAVEATVASRDLDNKGLLIDFRVLKGKLKEIMNDLDHKNLNDLPAFKVKNPTSENIAKYIYDRLKEGGIALSRVSVWESSSSCASYFGEKG